ncbi:MAG: hypothetical protein FJ265_06365 [Planctomycetes bacterium]|nr:hypothetical protein [Planctomycetota bacterium]
MRIERRRERGAGVIAVVDDGAGVIPELPREQAMTYIATHVGHSRKRCLTPEQRRELMVQGQYGIGLLGFWCLGRQLVMRSAAAAEPPLELHLFAEEPKYEIHRARGRLPMAKGTEVLVRDVKPAVQHVLGARRLGDYLAAELRGQILERGANVVIHDRIARGLAQKVFRVKPVQYEGQRLLLPAELPVAGRRPARLELYLAPEGEGHRRVVLAAAGTTVLDDVVECDPDWFAGTAFASGRLTGVIDFPELEVSPGSRRGIVRTGAVDDLLLALSDLFPALQQRLGEEQRRKDEEAEKRQIKRLRRAFLEVRRKAPEFQLFPVRAGSGASMVREPGPAARAGGEALEADTARAAAPEVQEPQEPQELSEPSEPSEPAAAAQAELFPPGPLAAVEVAPRLTRVEVLGERRLRAVPRDADGRRVQADAPIAWRLVAGDGAIEPHSADGGHATFRAGEVIVEATARQGAQVATGEARVRVVLEGGAAVADALGIPSPEFVEDRAGEWRSRLREGRWEVNRAHPDFQEAQANERRQLRYLSSLLAKEVVLNSYPGPQFARPLEQLVRLSLIVDGSLERQGGRG